MSDKLLLQEVTPVQMDQNYYNITLYIHVNLA